MNSIPTVSVIVPCRNEKDYIENSIRSILAQEPPPGGFEVIVADGMSDDGTREILKRLTEEDSRLRVVDDTERIVPAGVNSAIRAARGQDHRPHGCAHRLRFRLYPTVFRRAS